MNELYRYVQVTINRPISLKQEQQAAVFISQLISLNAKYKYIWYNNHNVQIHGVKMKLHY